MRAQAADGELLLVLGTTTVLRVFAVTGIDRLISNFPSLDESLAQASAAPPTRSSPALDRPKPRSSPSC